MVHVETLHRQREFYDSHQNEILASGHRFAVITGQELEYFDTRDSLYSAHPYFKPEAQRTFGTLPLLVDVGKENNSWDYRHEKLQDDKKALQKDLAALIKRQNRIAEEEADLRRIEDEHIIEVLNA